MHVQVSPGLWVFRPPAEAALCLCDLQVPGAHLLLRVPAGQSAGDADLAFAADLAAWFSKARSEGKADVTVASPKDISKPRGAKPGMVMVLRERVLVGRPHRSAAAQAGGDDD